MATVQEAAQTHATSNCKSCNDRFFYGPCTCHDLEAAFQAGAIWQEKQGWVRVFREWIEERYSSVEEEKEMFGKTERRQARLSALREVKERFEKLFGSTPIESKEGKYKAALEEIIEAVSGTGTTMRIVLELATEALKP